MAKRSFLVWVLLGIALTSFVLLPQGAAAQQSGASAANQHCVATLEPVRQGATRSKVAGFECYPSFSEAIFAATEGAVWLAPDEERSTGLERLEQELQRMDKSLATKATFVIAIDFQNSNFQGASLTWTGTGACSASLSFSASSMPSGWNDVVSSTRGFSNCNHNKIFENNNFGGAQQTCTPNCSSLGAMNDKTSSRKWSV